MLMIQREASLITRIAVPASINAGMILYLSAVHVIVHITLSVLSDLSAMKVLSCLLKIQIASGLALAV